MAELTPSDEDVRDAFVNGVWNDGLGDFGPQVEAAFSRWLAGVRAKAKANPTDFSELRLGKSITLTGDIHTLDALDAHGKRLPERQVLVTMLVTLADSAPSHRTEAGDGTSTTNDPAPSGSIPTEADVIEWMGRHSSAAVARVVEHGRKTLDARFADGVFE